MLSFREVLPGTTLVITEAKSVLSAYQEQF